ncbi:MAG: 3-oxoacyl-[acyl-carrier-protein] synthase III C-terminal domain-containing protein [Hyphomonadaceae bacterium]
MATRIIGTGISVPNARLESAAWDLANDKPDGWLAKACGVAARNVAKGVGDTQERMAAAAAEMALADAGLAADALDLILFCAAVGRQPIPATAPLIKGLLGMSAPRVPAYDVNATCLSALVAMDIADMHIRTGRARHVLVVSSEIASRGLPWDDDPATAGLFGDGAGAIVLGEADAGDAASAGLRILDFDMETWPEGYDYCQLGAGGTRFDFASEREAFAENSVFRMDGHKLFKLSRKRVPDFVKRLLAKTGWGVEDIDLVVPHQASPLALEHMVRRCGFAPERVMDTVRETGNLIAASLPVTLHKARVSGRIGGNAKILMIGTSAGVSVAGMTLIG